MLRCPTVAIILIWLIRTLHHLLEAKRQAINSWCQVWPNLEMILCLPLPKPTLYGLCHRAEFDSGRQALYTQCVMNGLLIRVDHAVHFESVLYCKIFVLSRRPLKMKKKKLMNNTLCSRMICFKDKSLWFTYAILVYCQSSNRCLPFQNSFIWL